MMRNSLFSRFSGVYPALCILLLNGCVSAQDCAARNYPAPCLDEGIISLIVGFFRGVGLLLSVFVAIPFLSLAGVEVPFIEVIYGGVSHEGWYSPWWYGIGYGLGIAILCKWVLGSL